MIFFFPISSLFLQPLEFQAVIVNRHCYLLLRYIGNLKLIKWMSFILLTKTGSFSLEGLLCSLFTLWNPLLWMKISSARKVWLRCPMKVRNCLCCVYSHGWLGASPLPQGTVNPKWNRVLPPLVVVRDTIQMTVWPGIGCVEATWNCEEYLNCYKVLMWRILEW